MGRGRKSRRYRNQADVEAQPQSGMPTVYPTAIYVRLSVENLGRDDNGAAIENQKDVCREYIRERPDLQLVRIYEDNGWTGTVMRRPAFEEMLEDVKNGTIKAIVVRDLSRFARNYIEAGTYLESIFPDLGVRFISVKEGLDTLKAGDAAESLIVPLQNLINDLYSKDISRKVETTFAIQMREGAFRWRCVPYGYRKNEDGTNIVPDALRADIVRQIFKWRDEGITIAEIARRLNAADAPKSNLSFSQGKPWWSIMVHSILRNPAYVGVRVLGKEHSAIYKGIHREKTTPEHWHIFPDAHEPLVPREQFDRIQAMLDEDVKKRHDSMQQTAKARAKLKDLFEGKIFCADCGYRMYYSRHQFRQKERGWYGRYLCSSYQTKRVGHDCTSHYFAQKKLEAKVLAVIQTHIRIGLDYEKLIASFQGSDRDREKRCEFDAAIRRASQKLAAAQRKRTRLYEDYVAGILDESEYLYAKKSYEGETEKWDKHLEELVAQRNAYQEAMSPRNLWVKVMRSVRNIKKLTQELVDAVIERIYIYDSGDIHIVMKYQDIFELTKECLEGEKTDA